MSIRTTGAGIVQIKIANPSKRAAFRAIFNWTRQLVVGLVAVVGVLFG
jgi:hypothetical protein